MARVLVGVGGMALLVLGAVIEFSVNTQTPAAALAASAPYELYCPGTPLGSVVLNDVTTSATISPAAPTSGEQFTLSGYQTAVTIPSSLVSAVAALQPDLEGSATPQVDVTGATPAILAFGPLNFDVPIPTPVPGGGLSMILPSAPQSVGPFTAMSSDIVVQEDGRVGLMFKVSGNSVDLNCTAYANDTVTPSGVTTSAPSASPISPVIVTAGSPTTTSASSTTAPGTTATTPNQTAASTPPSILTGAYELYCPGSPLGNVVLNDVVTSAVLSPSAPTAGQSFSLANYQMTLDLPASLAGAAAAAEPDIKGSATTQIYGTGATPATTVQGPLDFDLPIAAPVPGTGVTVSLPTTPATVSGFTATSATVTIQQESSASISLTLADSSVDLACTAYPNDSLTPSGITSMAPTTSPIAPVIAMGGSITATPVTTVIPTPPATAPTTTPITAAPATTIPPTTPAAPSIPTTAAAETTTPPTTAPAPSTPPTTAPVTLVPTTSGPATANPTSTSPPSTAPPILIGPGPETTYVVQSQPAPGTCHYRYIGSDPLPDPTCTPGARNPRVDQSDIGTTICTAGYADSIRPPDSVTQKEKVASAAAYGYTGPLQTAEYDHLIPLELGGDPNDPSNLWVEPNDNPNATSTSNTKDTLENKLNDLVCSGTITLAQAQQAIATNWVTALQTYGGLQAGTTTTATPSTTSAPVTFPSGSSSSVIAVAGSSGATGASSTVATGAPPALAATGPGHGLKTMTLVGASTMFLGLLMLILADLPRRALRMLASHEFDGYEDRMTRRSLPKSVREDVAWGSGWLLGR